MSPAAQVPGPSERAVRGTGPRRRIVIWRHGQTTHNASGRWQGQLDTELSELGREQAARAATALAELKPAALYCSDLRRAADTAAALAAVTGLVPQADPRLREIHVGQWQGLTGAEVDERYPGLLEALARGDDPVRGETGESVAQVAVRARAALADITAATEPGQTIVIATHGVTGRTLAAELAGIDQRVAWISLAGLHNCHWAELVDHRFGWRIDRWNAGVQEAQR